MSDIILSAVCPEPKGPIIRYVRPLILTPENLQHFWDKAKLFPSLYGKEILDDIGVFTNMFMQYNAAGEYEMRGLLWVIDDFVGVFYMNDIIYDGDQAIDASVHYSFFDKRHRGRMPLVKAMLHYAFRVYGFRRLSTQVPNYSKDTARHFITDMGFAYEGKKRKNALYKNEWFDTNLYGILREEVLNGRV